MRRRISAVHKTVGLMISCIELLIGVSFFLKLFGSDETIKWLIEDIGTMFGQADSRLTALTKSNVAEGPVAFLLLVLGFMAFSFFLFTVFPRLVRRVEEEEEFEIE